MFSGKTTELIRRLTILHQGSRKVLYVNSSFDTRGEANFSTHNTSINNIGFDSIKTLKLLDVIDKIIDYDIIGIDEAHFFPDLLKFCLDACEIYKKKIIVCGLNGDYKREEFGQLLKLIPFCDTLDKLHSFCRKCNDKDKSFVIALFSKRIHLSTDLILTGSSESYVPLCRNCYLDY